VEGKTMDDLFWLVLAIAPLIFIWIAIRSSRY
jgi:hypothetical protein